MKKYGNLLWGLLLIFIGIIVGINSLGIAEINIFFKGWWTLFIIVPCFIGLFTENSKTGNIIGLLIGLFLLLVSQGILDFDLVWKLTLPAILIIIGISLLFKDSVLDKEIKKIKKKSGKSYEYWATFSSQNISFNNEEFTGADLNSIFGGIKFDLREAIIKEDIVLNATAIFGGIEILAPNGVKIKLKSNSIFGGSTNKVVNDNNEKSPTIFINSVAIFGGIEIK